MNEVIVFDSVLSVAPKSHVRFFRSTAVARSDISKPLFWTSPMFTSGADEKPDDGASGR